MKKTEDDDNRTLAESSESGSDTSQPSGSLGDSVENTDSSDGLPDESSVSSVNAETNIVKSGQFMDDSHLSTDWENQPHTTEYLNVITRSSQDTSGSAVDSSADKNNLASAGYPNAIDNTTVKVNNSEKPVVGVLHLPNATVGCEYLHRLILKDIMLHDTTFDEEFKSSFSSLGLDVVVDSVSISIKGVPAAGTAGENIVKLRHTRDNRNWFERKFSLFINADPKTLWKEIEPDPNLPFAKEHTEKILMEVEDYIVVGASRRGRSHAQEGKFREDHFIAASVGQGWTLLAVSDGAGTATFSRLGSKLACEAVRDFILHDDQVRHLVDLSAIIETVPANSGAQRHSQIRILLYKLLAGAAFSAYKRLEAESENIGVPLKDLSCTLLISIVKKFQDSTFVGSFGIGDGAIGVTSKKEHWSNLMNKPDGGEFSGQTRFLTMGEIIRDASNMARRIEHCELKEFTSLLMLSDGVSDPKFESEMNLNNSEKWFELINDISTSVNISRENRSAADELLEWLNFWVRGEHDDRTIVILSR